MFTFPLHIPQPPCSRNRQAFTLLEILVVLSIIIVLVILAIPVSKQIRQTGLNTRCISHLKATGTAILTHASENNGQTVTALYRPASDNSPNPDPYYPDHGANRVWSQSLQAGGYLSKHPDELVCPAFTPFRYKGIRANGSIDAAPAMHTYGLRQFSNAASTGVRQSDPALILSRIKHPSRYILLMDSYSRGENAQIYAITWPNSANTWSSNTKIHLRHNDRANLFFADGSVRGLNLEEMIALDDGLSATSVFTMKEAPLP